MFNHEMPKCPYCEETMRLDKARYFNREWHGRFVCPRCEAKSPWRYVPEEHWNFVEKVWNKFPEGAYNVAMKAEHVVHGGWIKQIGGYVTCSECGLVGDPEWKRCPVCEAKMDMRELLKRRRAVKE